MTARSRISVYAGRDLLGFIEEDGRRHRAVAASWRSLGSFQTRKAAAAVSRHAADEHDAIARRRSTEQLARHFGKEDRQ